MEAVTLAYDVFEPREVIKEETNPIILMHGLFWNKYMLQDLARHLCKETKRKVFSIDLRCHDESPFCNKWDMTSLAEDIKKFITDHNIKKTTFICHSFSSAIAYLVAMEQPETVEKMVMIDHGPWAKDVNLRHRASLQFNSQNRFLASLDPKMSLIDAKKKILNLITTTSFTKAQELFLRKVVHDLEKDGERFRWKTDIRFLMDSYKSKSYAIKPIGCCDHEILIVRCSNSEVSDEDFINILKHNPNAKLETMEDTTHLLMLEKMDTFVEIVKKFLDS